MAPAKKKRITVIDDSSDSSSVILPTTSTPYSKARKIDFAESGSEEELSSPRVSRSSTGHQDRRSSSLDPRGRQDWPSSSLDPRGSRCRPSSSLDPRGRQDNSFRSMGPEGNNGEHSTVRVNSQSQRKRAHPSKVVQEIKELQKTTHLLVRKSPFCRLVREVTMSVTDSPLLFTGQALLALQESSEAYLIQLLEDAYLCTRHAGRTTLMLKDLQLARRLRMRFEH